VHEHHAQVAAATFLTHSTYVNAADLSAFELASCLGLGEHVFMFCPSEVHHRCRTEGRRLAAGKPRDCCGSSQWAHLVGEARDLRPQGPALRLGSAQLHGGVAHAAPRRRQTLLGGRRLGQQCTGVRIRSGDASFLFLLN